MLIELQELHLALAELKVCKDLAPDEANVHFWLGKVYKALREKAEAIKHFTIALNLDPKVRERQKAVPLCISSPPLFPPPSPLSPCPFSPFLSFSPI